MADIDKITVNNTTYNVKDATARDSISHWVIANNTSSFRVDQDSSNRYFGLTAEGNHGKFTIIFDNNGIHVYDHSQGTSIKHASWTS